MKIPRRSKVERWKSDKEVEIHSSPQITSFFMAWLRERIIWCWILLSLKTFCAATPRKVSEDGDEDGRGSEGRGGSREKIAM